ncbi:tellurite resistance/C4-dicarboxylate transporter family protein [Pollutimonas sp. M17]|uniref:tellurite resistance/C4-dicarboxylate transporter family protein n=1 Tax=Pollutimonas sp. M17 TaxID=2962065 RepID=UPI0021F3D388|nr:tellurite resistance/C4-dicarboxylate transporter family protein [Pollutimonas sp. M17]UYO95495.1 tellurite resistance/C4-dicarboxylate transporter family protein [Pollutimonas sp. M17]
MPFDGGGNRGCEGLAAMSPANFGIVMATGIVSLAAHLLGRSTIAQALFMLNNVLFAILCALSVLRAVRHPRSFFGDMADHLRGPGFFTTVAATAILGGQYMVLANDARVGSILWAAALALWFGLTYAIFTMLTVKRDKPTLDRGINGGWLLAVVATQSIAVSSALLAATTAQPYRLELNFLALSMWLWGGMLYIWMMSLIFYRYTYFRLSPDDLTPPYWINMGAMAISTLAGSLLIINASDAPYLVSLMPFLKGFTIFYWATGTWWIPMLLLLGVWRYVYKRFPLRYDPLYWGAVFPLGMYAASTFEMNQAMGFKFLAYVPGVFFTLAIVAWTLTFLGLLMRVVGGIRRRS